MLIDYYDTCNKDTEKITQKSKHSLCEKQCSRIVDKTMITQDDCIDLYII